MMTSSMDPDDYLRHAALKLVEEMPQEEALQLIRVFGYFRAKAQIYLRKGPDAYREDDYFHVPRAEWSAKELADMEKALHQLMEWKGLVGDRPLEQVDMPLMYRLMELTHFQFQSIRLATWQADRPILTLTMKHRMDERVLQVRYRAQCSNILPNERQSDRQSRFCGEIQPMPAPRSLQSIPDLYGYIPACPIMCSDPLGELQFLNRLRCPNGHRLYGHRVGSLSGKCPDPSSHDGDIIGRMQALREGKNLMPLGDDAETPREADYEKDCIVDLYELCCHEDEHRLRLYFDMYHHGFTLQLPPSGLEIIPSNDDT